jgi:hypothetical protein
MNTPECTRVAGHSGPCNGLARIESGRACYAFRGSEAHQPPERVHVPYSGPRSVENCKHSKRSRHGSYCLDCDKRFDPHWPPDYEECPPQITAQLKAAEQRIADLEAKLAEALTVVRKLEIQRALLRRGMASIIRDSQLSDSHELALRTAYHLLAVT